MSSSGTSVFLVMCSGAVEFAELPEFQEIYCRYNFVFGKDWAVTTGVEGSISQISSRGQSLATQNRHVFNFPFDICFKSTNPHGWPRLVLECTGPELRGNDVVRGYGMVHVPCVPGKHTMRIPLFVPEPSSQFQQWLGWFFGRRPVLVSMNTVASGEGRDVTRMRSQGHATVTFNVILKDLRKMGYEVSPTDILNPVIPESNDGGAGEPAVSDR